MPKLLDISEVPGFENYNKAKQQPKIAGDAIPDFEKYREQRLAELDAEEKRINSRLSAIQSPGVMYGGENQMMVQRAAMPAEYSQYVSALKQIQDTRNSLKTYTEADYTRDQAKGQEKGFLSRLVGGATNVNMDDVLPFNPTLQLNSADLNRTLQKANRGEKLNDAEQTLLKSALGSDKATADIQSQGGATKAGDMGRSLPQSAKFMAETAILNTLFPVVGNSIHAAKGVTQVAKAMGKYLGNSAIREAGLATLRSNTWETAAKRQNNQYVLGEDENGNVGVVDHKPENLLKSIYLGGADSFTEGFSERFGGILETKVIGKLAPNILGAKIGGAIEKIGQSKVGSLVNQWDDTAKKIFNWNGTINEYVEEKFSDAIKPLLTGDDSSWRTFFDARENIITLGSVAVMGSAAIVIKAPAMVGDLIKSGTLKKEAVNHLKALSTAELKSAIQSAGAQQTLGERYEKLLSIDWSVANKEDAIHAIDYINTRTQYDIFKGSYQVREEDVQNAGIMANARAAQEDTENEIYDEATQAGVDPSAAIASSRGVQLNNIEGTYIQLSDGRAVYIAGRIPDKTGYNAKYTNQETGDQEDLNISVNDIAKNLTDEQYDELTYGIADDVAPTTVENNTPAVPQIPMTKDGAKDYDSMSSDMLARELETDLGHDVAVGELSSSIKYVDSQIKNINNRKAGSLNERVKRYAKIQELNTRKDNLLAALEVLQPTVTPPTQTNSDLRGDYLSLDDYILRDISAGLKFAWNDNGSMRGLARELGFTGSEGERRNRISLLRNDGMTVDKYAESIVEQLGGDLPNWNIDVSDARSAIIDVLLRVYSPKQAKNEAMALRNKHDDSQYMDVINAEAVNDDLVDQSSIAADPVRDAATPQEKTVVATQIIADWNSQFGMQDAKGITTFDDNSFNTLPENVQKAFKYQWGMKKQSTPGVTFGENVYLYIPHIRDVADLESTYVHEVLCHRAVNLAIGDVMSEAAFYADLVDNIGVSEMVKLNEGVIQVLADDYFMDQEPLTKMLLGKEYVAYLANRSITLADFQPQTTDGTYVVNEPIKTSQQVIDLVLTINSAKNGKGTIQGLRDITREVDITSGFHGAADVPRVDAQVIRTDSSVQGSDENSAAVPRNGVMGSAGTSPADNSGAISPGGQLREASGVEQTAAQPRENLIDDPVHDAITPKEKYEAVKQIVDQLNTQSTEQVIVPESLDQIPEVLHNGFKKDAQGVYYKGKVYINPYSKYIQTSKEVETTYIHEVAGHWHINNAIDSQQRIQLFEAIVDNIGTDAMMAKGIEGLNLEVRMYELGKNTKGQLGGEYLAYLGEQYFTAADFNISGINELYVNLADGINDDILKTILTSTNNGTSRIYIKRGSGAGVRTIQSPDGDAQWSDRRATDGTSDLSHSSHSNSSDIGTESSDAAGDGSIRRSGRGLEDYSSALSGQDGQGVDRVESGTLQPRGITDHPLAEYLTLPAQKVGKLNFLNFNYYGNQTL